MITPSYAGVAGDVHDATPDFDYAISLLAALEGSTGEEGHGEALPFLGMARAELVAFGQRRPADYVDVEIDDCHAGLAELEERLTAMLTSSEVLQHTPRVDAARRLLVGGIAAARRPGALLGGSAFGGRSLSGPARSVLLLPRMTGLTRSAGRPGPRGPGVQA